MVLNQVHPSRCATSNPSQQGICLGLGAEDIVAGRALRRMRPFQIGWKGEAGPSPIPRARSQKAWSMGSSRLKSGKSTRAPCSMATGGQGRPEVLVAFGSWLYLILTITIKHLQPKYFYCKHPGVRPAKLPENEGAVQKMSGQRSVYIRTQGGLTYYEIIYSGASRRHALLLWWI